MREYKFRGKIKETGEWVYGTLLRIPAPPQCIGNKKPDTYFIQFADPRYTPDWNMQYQMVQAEVIPETIGQYTGLHDKNEKEIYEEDLIKDCDYGIMICKFINGSFVWQSIKNKFYIKFFSYIPNAEVIGNIYENKSLLDN